MSVCLEHNYEMNSEPIIGSGRGQLPPKVGLCVLVKDAGIWQKGKIVELNCFDGAECAQVRLFDICETQILVEVDTLRGIDPEHFDLPLDPDFDFIDGEHNRTMIKYAYKTMQNDVRRWDYLRNYPGESLVWTDNERIRDINSHINWDYPGSHSGGSLSFVMKALERISHIGFNMFKANWIANKSICRNDI